MLQPKGHLEGTLFGYNDDDGDDDEFLKILMNHEGLVDAMDEKNHLQLVVLQRRQPLIPKVVYDDDLRQQP